MADAARNPDDYCYRHPDRLSFVLCERCARTICLECQIHVDGHVLCPDDATKQRVTLAPVTRIKKKPKRSRRTSRLLSRVNEGTPIVTYSLLGVLVLLFLVDTVTGGLVSQYLGFAPSGSAFDALHQPWALVTSMFLTGGILGLLFNGYSLYILGRQLERHFGRQKFLALYLIGGFGASVFSFLLGGFVFSAIGAVFGLIGAIVVLARRMGGRQTMLYVTCGISLLFAIFFGYWQAAIGGGLAGAATALIYYFEGSPQQAKQRRLLMIGIVAALLVLAVVRAFAFSG